MMKALKWIALTLLLAAGVHFAGLYLGPSMVMRMALGRLEATTGVNKIAHPPRPNASNNRIVRSSPDLLYSACVYDVSEKPLRVTAPVPPGTYWSVSFYDMNTNNYRVINDGQAAAGAVLLVLARKGALTAPPAGAELVESPTDRGVILFRTLIDSDSRLAELDEVRKLANCQVIN